VVSSPMKTLLAPSHPTSDLLCIESFLQVYLAANFGAQKCRYGGCYDLADEFINLHPDAERWELLEVFDDDVQDFPLVPPFESVHSWLNGRSLADVGALGAHCALVWRGIWFDALGVQSPEDIAAASGKLINPIWVRTE